ncbi:MAG TPA: AlpA family phage regulatory protein [Prosthecobacter sp.]|nr:AlpA family phage regulatory protein [Prosthecobacter sp.]
MTIESGPAMQLLKVKEVSSLVGLGVRTIWKQAAKGKFPRPIRGKQMGVRATRWTRQSVESWIRRRAEAVGNG